MSNEQTTEYDYAQALSSYADYSSQSINTYTDSNCTPQTSRTSFESASLSFESSATPFPSMTKSQRVKLDEILHREPIGYASTFNTDITEPVEMAEHIEHTEEVEHTEQVEEQKQNENDGCCVIM